MNAESLSREVDENFDFFQRNLRDYLARHSNEYALIRRKRVVGFYLEPGQADHAGRSKFRDGLYSIQKVTDEPVDLGLYSNAGN